jgi:hypothetical protein
MTQQPLLPTSLAAAAPTAAGGGAADRSFELRVYVGEVRQLFDSLDPSPFRDRDLDPKAAEYIVDSAREAPADAPLSLVVQLGREPAGEETASMLRSAVDEHFGRCAAASRRRLRDLFRTGRISLLIGLTVLGGAIALGEFLAGLLRSESHAYLIKETLIIGGWVALWRPMEIFLYDWWPIRAEARLFDRLATIPVNVRGGGAAAERAE